MVCSIQPNTKWLVEMQIMVNKGQAAAEEVEAYCRRIDQEIHANRAETNSQIMQEAYPRLRGLQEHKGPDGTTHLLDPLQKHAIGPNGEIVSGDQYPEEPGWQKMNPLQPGK
jgi:hypothetical protein